MYTDNHRTLLQVIINEGSILDEKLKEFSFKILPYSDIQTVIFEINEQLDSVNMMVKSSICDVSGEKYWVLISYTAATVDKQYMPYNQSQLTFLRTIFSEIITSTMGCISSVDSLNLLTRMNFRMFKTDAEDFIKELVSKKWLSTKEGWLFIGPRSTAELLNYFKENFADIIVDCDLCKQVIFYGKICQQCNRKTHFKCLQMFASARKNAIKCPSCNHNFDNIDDDFREYVNAQETVDYTMDAETELVEETLEPTQSTQPTQRKKSQRNRVRSDSE